MAAVTGAGKETKTKYSAESGVVSSSNGSEKEEAESEGDVKGETGVRIAPPTMEMKAWKHPDWDGCGSEGWQIHAGGIFQHFDKTRHIMVASLVCPCLVAGLNAHDVSWGQMPPEDSRDPKWGLAVAALYLANPCSVGSAVREEIWKFVTIVHEQDASRIKNNRSTFQQMRFFCLPHCYCTMCCAVAQDRRALMGAFRQVLLNQQKEYKPTFRMEVEGDTTGHSKDS